MSASHVPGRRAVNVGSGHLPLRQVTRSLGPNSAQPTTINGGKSCQTLAEFPLIGATIGPINADLCQTWVYGFIKSPRPGYWTV
jgi:hypothetical protein